MPHRPVLIAFSVPMLALVSIVQLASALPQLATSEIEVDAVGDVDGAHARVQKALQDTTWIADWSFDFAMPCDDSGWQRIDNRILNDGVVHWQVDAAFASTGGISGNAAVLGYSDSSCCVLPNGYDNDWYQAIRSSYAGAATLSFAYLLDSQSGADYLRVETDSACASFERVDYLIAPNRVAASFRKVEFSASGLQLNGSLQNLPLTDYGPGTHCVHVSFFSSPEMSPCDGGQSTTIGKALVLDDLSILDSGGTRTEDFEDGTLDIGEFLNIQDSEPFGEWARTFRHVTDNDLCTENTTCAWLWTDDTTPTMANDPSMAFGPDGYVVRNWLDDVIISPWVSLTETPGANGTVLQLRRFGGNLYHNSRAVQNWAVRGREGTPGCVSYWRHSTWDALAYFKWTSFTMDMSAYFDPSSAEVQVRLRTSDWQWIAGAAPPSPFLPGPGPYVDRVRIGRHLPTGPGISEGVDGRTQAQDGFPTQSFPTGGGTGEHFQPSTSRFGAAAFSMARDIGARITPNLITGDSIAVHVYDMRDVGGVTMIAAHLAVVAGPHAGKAPAPWQSGSNGFFVVPADTVRLWSGQPSPDDYFVDLDDTYFRGGDVLHYFWLATDALGGVTSDPAGLHGVPASRAEAEAATGGLLEVSFLPTIDWDPAYLARIAADPHGDLDPTPQEITNSNQKNCILYVQMVNLRRRSGDANRTSFMYTLDRLGYRAAYDVYDMMGLGDTNNHIGGRATIQQAQGYNLIVYDAGNMSPGGPIMPDGSPPRDTEKIDQVTWFRNWLAQASVAESGFATLWILGSNALQERPTAALYTTNMGVVLNTTSQASGLNPNVDGVASFGFDRGAEQTTIDFGADFFSLSGGCPTIRNYDGLGTSGTAVATHRYRAPVSGALGDAAIVMNRNPAENWNTIFQSHPWFDIRDPQSSMPSTTDVRESLMLAILAGTLPAPCLQQVDPTDAGGPGDTVELPAVTALHANVPNPFNPTTVIPFDLAQAGLVSLRIYDVTGHLVRTLVDEVRQAGWNQRVVWDGLDQGARPVASGVYFSRLDTAAASLVRKIVVLR